LVYPVDLRVELKGFGNRFDTDTRIKNLIDLTFAAVEVEG
jgi:hypothetical protein